MRIQIETLPDRPLFSLPVQDILAAALCMVDYPGVSDQRLRSL